MRSYYKTIDGHITQLEACEPGCWINCIAPTDAEISGLIEDFQIEPDFFRAAMDEEESSHIDTEDYSTLVIIDMPVAETSGDNVTYSTTPLGIIITEKNVITVCTRGTDQSENALYPSSDAPDCNKIFAVFEAN